MSAPPTYHEALARGLTAPHGKGVYTFSNGSAFESWADRNCYTCRYYDSDTVGNVCAFECASFMRVVSPALARMFGWTNDQGGDWFGWKPPEQCSYYAQHREDGDDGDPWPPKPDPNQLVLIADPKEDLAAFPAPALPDEVSA